MDVRILRNVQLLLLSCSNAMCVVYQDGIGNKSVRDLQMNKVINANLPNNQPAWPTIVQNYDFIVSMNLYESQTIEILLTLDILIIQPFIQI